MYVFAATALILGLEQSPYLTLWFFTMRRLWLDSMELKER